MKFIDINYEGNIDEVLKLICDNNAVNSGVVFDESKGIPQMRVKNNQNGKIKITCEMVGGPTRDNGFLVGTYFSGKLTEKDGRTRLKGMLTTAPIYHTVLILFIGLFIYQCIKLGGFSVIPIFIVAFDVILFWKEFKKQGFIERYLHRAARRMKN